MDHGEDGDVRPHAERQRRQGDPRNRGRAPPGAARISYVLLRHPPVLAWRVKQQVARNLEPQSDAAFLRPAPKQQRHLLSVLVAEITRVSAEEQTVDALGDLHGVILRSTAGWSSGRG